MKGAADVLGVIDADQRYDYIAKVLAHQKQLSRYWNVTWTALATVGTAGYLALPAVIKENGTDKRADLRVGFYVSALKAGLAAVSWAVLPLRIPELPSALAGESTCKRLARAEALLHRAAVKERRKRLFDRLTSVVANVASGLYLWLERDDLLGAAISTGSGIVIIEVKARTMPVGATEALRAYKRGQIPDRAPTKTTWRISAMALPGGGGLSIGADF